MARYRLPAAFGAVELHSDNDREYAVDFVVDGCMVTFPRKLLVEVRPTIPDEPGPGAYLIGGVLCERDDSLDRRPQEFAERENWRVMGESIEWPWSQLWKSRGGPDVRIVALVPKPEPPEWEQRVILRDAVVYAALQWRKRMDGPIAHGQLPGSWPETRALVAAVDDLGETHD